MNLNWAAAFAAVTLLVSPAQAGAQSSKVLRYAFADSPERTRLYRQMAKLAVAYAPLKHNTHRILTDMWYPWVIGFRRPASLGNHFWKYMDIDLARLGTR